MTVGCYVKPGRTSYTSLIRQTAPKSGIPQVKHSSYCTNIPFHNCAQKRRIIHESLEATKGSSGPALVKMASFIFTHQITLSLIPVCCDTGSTCVHLPASDAERLRLFTCCADIPPLRQQARITLMDGGMLLKKEAF